MDSRDLVLAVAIARAEAEIAQRDLGLHTKPLAAAHIAAAGKARPVAGEATVEKQAA